jgi:hypothetical protein
MLKIDRRNTDATTSGLNADIQWTARRQLLGSTVVAVMIAATGCLTAMRPVRAEMLPPLLRIGSRSFSNRHS